MQTDLPMMMYGDDDHMILSIEMMWMIWYGGNDGNRDLVPGNFLPRILIISSFEDGKDEDTKISFLTCPDIPVQNGWSDFGWVPPCPLWVQNVPHDLRMSGLL